MAKSRDILNDWLEEDLTAAAAEGRLHPAYEVDDPLGRLFDVLGSGTSPVLVGESGIGKTAIVHELARRVHAGNGPAALTGRRFLQFSLAVRMSGLKKPDQQMRPQMQKLVTWLASQEEPLVIFFRDLHLAYQFDLEPQLQSLSQRFKGLIIGESDRSAFEAMLEHAPNLAEKYIALAVHEPTLSATRSILEQWSAAQAKDGVRFEAETFDTALELTHRFIARSRLPRKALDLLSQVATVVGDRRPVRNDDVIERFFRVYRVPRALIDPAISWSPDEAREYFGTRLLEQPEAVDAVVRMMSLIKSGLSDPRRPFGAFLFVGPTGVGKTHIAQLLASHLFGSRDRLIRLNMADYQSEADALAIFGNPDAYSIRGRRGILTNRLMGQPFSVLLLDEFEKAHPLLHDRFLQLIDEGAFINAAAETISCRSTIIVATTNAGAEVYREQGIGFNVRADTQRLDGELDRLLRKSFRHEFLNRFDQVVHFHPLTRGGIRAIARRELEELAQRSGVRSRQFDLLVDEAVVDWLSAHGYDPLYGARFLRRALERHVSTALADLLVRETIAPKSTVELTVRRGKVCARLMTSDSGTAGGRHSVRVPEGTTTTVQTLDRPALDERATELLARAKARIDSLSERRDEATALLETMNASGFWNDRGAADRILERYREVDVAIQAETRLAAPLQYLAEISGSHTASDDRPVASSRLATALERAARALWEWEERTADEGPARVWLLLRNMDAGIDATEWLESLTSMEQGWCRRLSLASEVVAFGRTDGVLSRVALEVEGPGAASTLAMEQGIHRLHRPRGRDFRARVDVIACSGADTNAASETGGIWPVRGEASALGITPDCGTRIEWQSAGRVIELFAENRSMLQRLASDLAIAELAGPDELQPARAYAKDGVGARDPRTGVTIARMKDAMAGKLDTFLEAWRQRSSLLPPPARSTQA